VIAGEGSNSARPARAVSRNELDRGFPARSECFLRGFSPSGLKVGLHSNLPFLSEMAHKLTISCIARGRALSPAISRLRLPT
jgi:hypothetical protein